MPPRVVVLMASLAALALPTIVTIAATWWSTPEGAQGPIVVGIALWLIGRRWPAVLARTRRPPSPRVLLLAAPILPVLLVARIGGIVEVEGMMLYLFLLVLLYSVVGGAALRQAWFGLFFLLFALPVPDSVIALATQPLRLMVSHAAVSLLTLAGYPVGSQGVLIFIGQYELLVADACSGLNSLLSLTALALLYIYLRHRSEPRQALLLAALAVPMAIVANLVRVLVLVLLTYHCGAAIAQSFLHELAGLLLFIAALGGIVAIDRVIQSLRPEPRHAS
ncbi:MAG TPA: exosortase V [Novosphingobium sp.]